MGAATMGKVLVTAKIESVQDLLDAERGLMTVDQVRTVIASDALVDTGATNLCMPKRLIDQLGIRSFRTRRARTSGGTVFLNMYGPVRLTVQDRTYHGDVAELPDECPVLIGQLPLEGLDFVVDPIGQQLLGNPAHGGEHMIEVY